MSKIPNPVCAVVSKTLSEHYYNHAKLNTLFISNDAPGDPPEGSCIEKCRLWFKRINDTPGLEPLNILGGILEEFMEIPSKNWENDEIEDIYIKRKDRIEKILTKYELTYYRGKIISQNGSDLISKDLESIIKKRNLPSLLIEYQRTRDLLASDPPVAITAASAIFEALSQNIH